MAWVCRPCQDERCSECSDPSRCACGPEDAFFKARIEQRLGAGYRQFAATLNGVTVADILGP